MIEFQLDPASGVATYVQLAQQVRQALRLGLLQVGDQLPTAREVVAKLAINPNTVLKAYRELERERLVGARPGQGTFVLRSLPGPDAVALARFSRALGTWMREARSAGFGPDDIDAIYQAAVRNCFSEGAA
jgi:DNA-binding transcriptional regulator YhcF (GntR family)